MIPDPLAPANAAADATVAALQGAPHAPTPAVGAPSAPVAPPAAPAAATPAPMPAPGSAPVPEALARVPGLLEQIDAGAAKAAEGAAKLAAAPPAPQGMIGTQGQDVMASTPEQAAAGAQKLGEAQSAGATAAQKATQQAAVVDVNEYWQKRAAQQLAEQRYLAEKQATDAIQERVMKDYQQTADGELDPDRIFSGVPGTGWGLISTILGMVVGGAAAGPIGAVMMAVKGVDKAIRSDLERQKELKTSRLAQYPDILGDQQLAYQRLYSQQLNLAAQQADVIAAEAKARGTMGNITALPDILRAQKAREEAQFAKDHQTKRSLEYTNELLLKKPGAGQALAPETAPVIEAFKRHGVDVKDPGYRDYVQKRVEQAPYMNAVKTAGSTLEQVMGRIQGQDVPGYGRADEKMPVEMLGPEAKAVQQTFNNAVDEFGRKKSGAAITKDEWAFLNRIATGGGSLAEMRRGVAIMTRRGQSALDEYDKGFPQYRNLQRELDGIERSQNPKTPFNESELTIPPTAGPTPGMTPASDAEARAQRNKPKTAGAAAVEGALFGGQPKPSPAGAETIRGAEGDPDAVDEFFSK